MQSTDVQKILNLQERGPYLFDEDGRSPITEQSKEKYPENETGIKNTKKTVLSKAYTEVNQQFSNFMEDLKKKYETLENKLDEYKRGTPEYDIALRELINLGVIMETRNEGKTSMDEVLLIINKVANNIMPDGDFATKTEEKAKEIKDLLDKGKKISEDKVLEINAKTKEIHDKELEIKDIDNKLSSTGVNETKQSSKELSEEQERLKAEKTTLDETI
jgi:hypothetical protein